MKKELIFCAPFRRQYYTDITRQDYDAYSSNGIESSQFWDEIFENMVYRDWYFGCYAEDKTFEIGYRFSLKVDGEEVDGFQQYFKNLYKQAEKSLKAESTTQIISEADKDSEDFCGICMSVCHDRAEMVMQIDGDFDINKFSIKLEKSTVLDSDEIIEIYTPYYDGQNFDDINLDDENRDDPVLFLNNQFNSLDVYDDE
jgi:ferredoxin